MGQGATMALPIFAYYMKKIFANPEVGYSPKAVFDMPRGYNPCESFIDDMTDVDDLEEIYE